MTLKMKNLMPRIASIGSPSPEVPPPEVPPRQTSASTQPLGAFVADQVQRAVNSEIADRDQRIFEQGQQIAFRDGLIHSLEEQVRMLRSDNVRLYEANAGLQVAFRAMYETGKAELDKHLKIRDTLDPETVALAERLIAERSVDRAMSPQFSSEPLSAAVLETYSQEDLSPEESR